ncbi:MAG: restriction endonuclease subunit S [Desulfobacteraceae bacterium]|nr:MAG: restriction endonuclease subunit S [Desulfobacteraceae bacterium]
MMSGPIKIFCIGIYDGPHATPKESDSGPIFLGIKNVTADGRLDFSDIRHVSEEEFPKWIRRVKPQKDDIVFSYEATLHRYAIIPEDFHGCLGRRMALVRADKQKVHPRFLHYYFMSQKWFAVVEANIINGATVDRIPIKKFPDFGVAFPRKEIQKEIAGILSAYDDLIENNRRRIALLEQAARLLYKEWFVHLRFPGHEHVKIKDGVPEGWKKACVGDVLTLQRGFDLPLKFRKEGNVPIYASTGINGYHNVAKVNGPGVVTGRSGSLGTVLYVPCDFWPLNTTLWVKEFKRVGPIYAVHLLSELQLEQYNGGAAVPTLNRNDVHRIDILSPPNTLMDSFDEHVDSVYLQIENLKMQNIKLAKARDLLLPRLMNGEIVV